MGPYILRMVCLLRVALTRIASRGHPVVLERIGAGTAWGLCGARVHRIYPKSLLWGGPPLLVLGGLGAGHCAQFRGHGQLVCDVRWGGNKLRRWLMHVMPHLTAAPVLSRGAV